MNAPSRNLFDYATSELSQDAFLAWLCAWSHPDATKANKALNAIGRGLVGLLVGRTVEVRTLEVKLQYERIDVLLLVNDDLAIVVEDKVGTTQHDDQLARYMTAMRTTHHGRKILGAYVQTFEQADWAPVEKAGYRIVKRKALLELLEGYNGDNAILTDFRNRLQRLDEEHAFEKRPILDWTHRTWQGYFVRLKELLGDGSWGYVSNPSGGFQGFWWGGAKFGGSTAWAQLEEHVLCFKLEAPPARRRDLCAAWHRAVVELGEQAEFLVKKPTRFRYGATMTFARLQRKDSEQDHRKTSPGDQLDLEATLQWLKEAQALLQSAAKRLEHDEPKHVD